MTKKEKLKIAKFEKYWKEKGRQDNFTWTHRYLRLHSDLLEDPVYKNLYDYTRKTLIAYIRRDLGDMEHSDEEIGMIIDLLADLFNEDHPKSVNRYKVLIEAQYPIWKEYPLNLNDIRI